jgi:malate/lactate dehydrogenase
LRGCATEILVIDRTPARARGLVTDFQYGATLSPPVTVRAGDYPDLGGAALVMITAGVNEKAYRLSGDVDYLIRAVVSDIRAMTIFTSD